MLQCKGSLVGECWRCTERVSVCEAEICHRPVGMRSISRGAGAETLDPMASWYLLVSVGCMINIDKLLTFWSCEYYSMQYAFQKNPFKEAKVWLHFASLELIWIATVWLQFASLELIWIDHCLKACLAVNPLVQWNHGRVLSCGAMPMSIFLIVRISCSMEPSIQSMVRALAKGPYLLELEMWLFDAFCSLAILFVVAKSVSFSNVQGHWPPKSLHGCLGLSIQNKKKEPLCFGPPWCY